MRVGVKGRCSWRSKQASMSSCSDKTAAKGFLMAGQASSVSEQRRASEQASCHASQRSSWAGADAEAGAEDAVSKRRALSSCEL